MLRNSSVDSTVWPRVNIYVYLKSLDCLSIGKWQNTVSSIRCAKRHTLQDSYCLLQDEYKLSQASKLLNFNHWPSNLTTWRTRLGTVKSANVKLHAHIHTHTHTESANLVFFVVNSTGMKDICDKVLKNYTLQSIRLLTKANQWYLQIEYREILPSFVFFLHAPGVI